MNFGFSGPIAERELVVLNGRTGKEVIVCRDRELNELLDTDGGIMWFEVERIGTVAPKIEFVHHGKF